MLSAAVFLVVDDHPESRYLLVRTLLRKFPEAIIEEFDSAEPALARVRQGEVTAIITHRTYDVTGIELVRMFRAADPRVP
ncbi:MAG: hypothetical protein Q7S40_07885 [Opitutaceae bacterium]|nr:hypothetical protein [Opitutaceae bacterium]